MHLLHPSTLKNACAWRLRIALHEVYARPRAHNSTKQASADIKAWLNWARRCGQEPFKRLAATLTNRFETLARAMVDRGSNAIVEGANRLLQEAKRARLGFRTRSNLIAAPTCANRSSSTWRLTRSSLPYRREGVDSQTKRRGATKLDGVTPISCED
jgi:hypothetical protein